jgi:hypothetical protein
MRILVDTVERLLLVAAAQMPEARAGGIDEHEIGHVDEAVLIVDDPVRRRSGVCVVGGAHALRAESAHVQPHRR